MRSLCKRTQNKQIEVVIGKSIFALRNRGCFRNERLVREEIAVLQLACESLIF